MTALAEKLQAAGVNTDAAHLATVVSTLNAKHNGDRTAIVRALALAILKDKALLRAVVDLVVNKFLPGQLQADTHRGFAQKSGGQKSREPQSIDASAPIPKPRSPEASFAAVNMGRVIGLSVMDTWKLSDGTPIGDVKSGQIPRLKSRSLRDAALLGMIENYAVASDPFTAVRDAVPIQEIQKMIQKTAEVSDGYA